MEKLNYTLPPTYHLGNQGCGCFLELPGHPSYFTRSVYTRVGNNPPGRMVDGEYQAGVSYEFNGMYFTELEDVNKYFKPLPLEHERTQAWIACLFGYFKNCYHNPDGKKGDDTLIYPVPDYQLKHFHEDERFSEEWRTKERASIKQANAEIQKTAKKLATLDNHKAVRFIRQHYPDFKATAEMLKLNGYGKGDWWTRLEKRPTPEQCPGDKGTKHPVNGTWCQFCGWRAKD